MSSPASALPAKPHASQPSPSPSPSSSSRSHSSGRSSGLSLMQWLYLAGSAAAAVKTISVIYHLRQCQRRERIIRDLVDATQANMPRLLMPPIIINEADPSSATSASARGASVASNPASTTIRILAVTDRRPSLVMRERPELSSQAHKQQQQQQQQQQPSASSSSSVAGLWHKSEGELSKSDRHRLEKVLSRVHLFMQPRWTLSPNVSPACTMLEAFLRLNQIPYTAHVVNILNNRDVVGKARASDVPQEDGGNAAGARSAAAGPTSVFGTLAGTRSAGTAKSMLQFMDSTMALAQQKLDELDDLHRRMPFIVYRGDVVTGSFDTITAYLMDRFHLPDLAARADDGTGDQVALAQALRRTMLFTLDMQYKVSLSLESPRVFARYAGPAFGYPVWAMQLWIALPWFSQLKNDVRKSLRSHDLGALTREQFHVTALRDMEMIEALLRNPDYDPEADDAMGQAPNNHRRQTPTTPLSMSSSLSNSWAGNHGGAGRGGSGGGGGSKSHPSRFLFSKDTPSREDCVLYAYLMPMLRLSDADVDGMPADANDAFRFAHESDVFADFVRRMTSRAFPDFDRMVCLVMGINPAQLFISRYSAPCGGDEGLLTPRNTRRGAGGGRRRGSSIVQPTSKPVPAPSSYEDSLRASAAPAAVASHSLNASMPRPISPPVPVLTQAARAATQTQTPPVTHRATPPPPQPVAVPAAQPATTAPRVTTTKVPSPPPPSHVVPTTTTTTATPAAVPASSVPKLVFPNSVTNPTPPAPAAPPRVTPAPPPVAIHPQPQQQTPPVRMTTTPAVSNRSSAVPTSRLSSAPPQSAPPSAIPAVRYTPSDPSTSASAIRKSRPAGAGGTSHS